MRILFLAPSLPFPARSGATIRNLSLIRALAERHEVTLLSFQEAVDGPAQPPVRSQNHEARGPAARVPPELSALCRSVEVVPAPVRPRWRRLIDLPGPRPDLVRRLASPAFAARAHALFARGSFDLVHVGGLEMAEFGYPFRDRAAILLDEHNAEYVLQQRAFENECRPGGSPVGLAYSLLQWRKLRRYEAMACRLADGVMAVSQVDRQAIRAIAPRARVVVVPNSIDVREYQPREGVPAGPPTLVFTGKMDFRPNVDAVVWFCRAVLPLLRAKAPDLRFQIVGRSPTPKVRDLGRQPGVEVVGAVPDDRPYVAGAHACVVPMRVGGGTRIKILQAMAAGVPVVATTLGCEGVAATAGEHLLVADQPADFARTVLELLSSPELASRLAERGRRFVEATYDWRVLARPLDDFYTATVRRRLPLQRPGRGTPTAGDGSPTPANT